MANQKLSALTTIPAVDRAADLLYIVDNSGGTSNKVTPNVLLGISGDPVGTSDVQTLTNKTLTSPTISGPTLSGTLTGTYTIGGTPTFPSSVVTLTGNQTLTNKTLTSPTINTPTITNPTLTTDTVSEFTSANGVTIDGLNIKDSALNTNNSVPNNAWNNTGVFGSSWAWTSWTPTLGGWSSNPTGGVYYYTQVGKKVTLSISQPNNGTSNGTTCTLTLPVTAVTRSNARWTAPAEVVDNGSAQTSPGLAIITSGATSMTVALNYGFGGFTASGNKRIASCLIEYEAA